MNVHLWLVVRFATAGRRLLSAASVISLIGMIVGVACLTAAMGVVSGYERTLKAAIVDLFGDVMLVHRGDQTKNVESIVADIKRIAPEAQTYTPFVSLEGLLVADSKLSGVVIQGVEPSTVERVLNLRGRLVRGEFSFSGRANVPAAMVGRALANKFHIEVGQVFKVVLPTPSRTDATGFSPRIMSFWLSGVLDLGKADYDERTILTDLRAAQNFAGIGDAFTGLRIRLDDSEKSRVVAERLSRELGPHYWTSDWTDANRNIFEAVKIERVVIFLVVLVMVVAASFNISSNLFISVLQRYSDISILRAIGFSRRDVAKVFFVQGLFFGFVGTVAGILLGLVLCGLFLVLQESVLQLPADTYRISRVGVDIRAIDLAMIATASLFICLLSTLLPARKGAALDPVEGLRYE